MVQRPGGIGRDRARRGVSANRELMHLRAPLTDYPTLSWFAEVVDTALAVPIATGVVLGIDPAGQAKVVDSSGDERALCPGVRTDELTACSTTLTEVQAMRWIMVLLIRYR